MSYYANRYAQMLGPTPWSAVQDLPGKQDREGRADIWRTLSAFPGAYGAFVGNNADILASVLTGGLSGAAGAAGSAAQGAANGIQGASQGKFSMPSMPSGGMARVGQDIGNAVGTGMRNYGESLIDRDREQELKRQALIQAIMGMR